MKRIKHCLQCGKKFYINMPMGKKQLYCSESCGKKYRKSIDKRQLKPEFVAEIKGIEADLDHYDENISDIWESIADLINRVEDLEKKVSE